MNVEERFSNGDWTAAVVGLGNVGLPFAINAQQRGVNVVGFDVNRSKVAGMAAGISPVGGRLRCRADRSVERRIVGHGGTQRAQGC